MNPIVRQRREAFAAGIERNVSVVYYFYNKTLRTERVRIAHESSSVPANKTTPVGLGTSFSMFCELRYDSVVTENTVLCVNSVGWKVGPVDKLSDREEIYGKRAPLTKIDVLGNSKAITSVKINGVSGVIAGTVITVTLPVGTDVTALVPNIGHTGKMVTPSIAQDFTTDKQYVVTAEDLSTATYTIKVVLD